MLQGAEGGFTTGPPAQRSPEPALLLLLGPLSRESSARRQRHLLHPQGLRLALVLGGEKTAVSGGHLRRLPEPGLLLFERLHAGRVIVRIALENLVAAHDGGFHLL